tara:strand:- start:47 stop:694 length:648 start_codon:yes stop_codon:yes gene_type:complete
LGENFDEKWFSVLKDFSLDPKYPRGRVPANSDTPIIGLPAWKRLIGGYEKYKANPKKYIYRPVVLESKDLEGSEKLVEEIARTIGHEYTHIATRPEVRSARVEAVEEFADKVLSGESIVDAVEKFTTINFLNEYMSRAGHKDRQSTLQLDSFLNRGVLDSYAPKTIVTLERVLDEINEDWEIPEEENVKYINQIKKIVTDKMLKLAIEYREKLGV